MKIAEYSCAIEFGGLTCGQGEVVCYCDLGSSGFFFSSIRESVGN